MELDAVKLGETGLQVSELALGTVRWLRTIRQDRRD
jgi:aryl-alcohol dehydrogenase-like predicted oxidoreductase